MLPRLVYLSGALILSTAATVLAPNHRAIAADRVYFTYGPLGRSIAVQELEDLVKTGKASNKLQWYLNFAHVKPEELSQVLTKEINLDFGFVNRVAYRLPGEYVLFQLGQILHTKSRQGEIQIQALRSTIVLSVSDDNKISLLEFLEKYPTPELYVDGVVLARVARRVNRLVDRIEPTLSVIREFLEGLVCNCDPNQTVPGSGETK
jgi:hypothetical protein